MNFTNVQVKNKVKKSKCLCALKWDAFLSKLYFIKHIKKIKDTYGVVYIWIRLSSLPAVILAVDILLPRGLENI